MRPTYRGVIRSFPLGPRLSYRGPRDQVAVDNFVSPPIFPQVNGRQGRDQLTVAPEWPLIGSILTCLDPCRFSR
jgi:hypothetical protein